MKVFIIEDELHPFYILQTTPHYNPYKSPSEIPDELVERYKKIRSSLYEISKEIEGYINK